MKHTKLLSLLSSMILLYTYPKAQGIVVQQGAYIVSKDALTITSSNSSITGSGVVDLSSAVLNLNGNKNVSIGTAGGFAVKEVSITKAGANVFLATNVTVKSKVTMVKGLLDLNKKNLMLDSTASINGETEISRIIGNSGGEIIITKTLNNPQSVNLGNLGATITSSKNLGSVTIRRGHKVQTGSASFGSSMMRYYIIQPLNNASLNATLRLNYFNAELNATTEPKALIFGSTNGGLSWTSISPSSRDTNLNYIEKKFLPTLSEFTMANQSQAASSSIASSSTIKNILSTVELKAWPLPANGPFNLMLNGDIENTEAMLYDNNGRLLQRFTLTAGTPYVVSNLSPGIYFIKTTSPSVNTLKVIVQ